VSGLRGAADITNDGKVTLNEAYQYAFHETLARTESTQGGPQHPGYDVRLSGTGEVVMTDLRGTSATLTIEDEMEGRLFVRDEKGLLVVELRKYQGRPVELGLEPGKYQVTLERGPFFQAEVKVAKGKTTVLSEKDMKPVKSQATVQRGGAAPGSQAEPKQDQAPVEAEPYDTVRVSWALIPEFNKRQGKLGLRRTFHYNSFNLLAGGYYKLHGAGIGIIGQWAVENVKGAQISIVGNFVGDTLDGFQGTSIINMANHVQGLQLSSTLNLAAEVNGGQGSGLANFALDVKGGQGSALLNYTGKLNGGQGTAGINIARDVKGGQGAAVGNLSRDISRGQGSAVLNIARDVKGGQGTAVANLARDVKGGQGSAVLNIARDINGVQGTAVANLARNLKGGQGSAVLNIAGEVQGGQISAVLNIAKRAEGFQIGLVNLAWEMEGETVGILNLNKNAKIHPSIWLDEAGVMNVGLTTGMKHIYGLINIGMLVGRDIKGRRLASHGLGLGVRMPVGSHYIHTDVSQVRFQELEEWYRWDSNFMIRHRIGFTYAIFSHLRLTAGGSLNYARMYTEDTPYQDYLYTEEWGKRFRWDFWPGFYAGLEF
jgi:hypothetical protein